MLRRAFGRGLCGLIGLVLVPAARTEGPPTGLQPEVRVRQPTRLDWEFVASRFGRDALKLPADFNSRKQTYQLYVPPTYKPDRGWPLVLHVSPGDRPDGWRAWQKVCEQEGMLFCAPYAAGNGCPPGQRVRIVLDALDQVRRDYRIDPDQTVATGFSGGGRVACTVAFALPDYFGGVVPVGGTNPLDRLDYLRHRTQDRLSVAFVTGATDFNRTENERLMHPLLRDVGVRTRLWVVPGLGHGQPGPAVLAEVRQWLHDDVARRRQDAVERPLLACPPDDELTPERLATRLIDAAELELKDNARVWRGVTLLQGVRARWGNTRAAVRAKDVLAKVEADPRLLRLAGEQGGGDERAYLLAQAAAFEAFGRADQALAAWKTLADDHPASAEGRRAAEAVERLAGQPFLGVGFTGDAPVVNQVAAGGAGDTAGLKVGDRVMKFGDTPVRTTADVRTALGKRKPGDRVAVEIERKGAQLTVEVVVGSPMASAK